MGTTKAINNTWLYQAQLYIPQDRRIALALGIDLPRKTEGAALFADISGFTSLTEAFADTLGLRRGTEELSQYLNAIYDVLIRAVNDFGGSVISFSGDAITCWFDDNNQSVTEQKSSLRAVTCAMAMQSAMRAFSALPIPGRESVALSVKVGVAYGPAQRFLVGDPEILLYDVLAGETIYRVAKAESVAAQGEVLLDESIVEKLGENLQVSEWRQVNDEPTQPERFAVLTSLKIPSLPTPWLDSESNQFSITQVRSWVHPTILKRLQAGMSEFLTELRPTVAIFLRFTGIDYDNDPQAEAHLNEYICGVQRLVKRFEGNLLEITIGDKGSYLYISFGACVSHEDDTHRAILAAMQLRQLKVGLGEESQVQIGVTRGTMRCGAYGGSTRRSFGALGDDVNLAARLMSQAVPGEVLVSRRVHKELSTGKGFQSEEFAFIPRPLIQLKGKAEPIPVFAITNLKQHRSLRLQEPAYGLPMVGRELERSIMVDKISLASSGQGQVVGITGEPGIGKSRFVAEAIHLARTKSLVGFGGACQSDGTQIPYLVWKPIWWAFFDLDPEDTLRRQLRSLEGEVEDLAPDRLEALPLLGELLGLPIAENDFTQSLEPKHRRSALEALLLECLRARAHEISHDGGGLFLVLEDVHWIDAPSHDLLERIARAISQLPVLVILAYRPAEIARVKEPRVETLTHFTRLTLSELGPAEIEQALRAKLAQLYPEWHGTAPKVVVERLIIQSQGNPFYAEELVNYLHDRDLDLRDENILQKVDLPSSLNSLVISRIDQLTAGQQLTIKVASVLGRVFRFKHLRGYYPDLGEPTSVKSDLDTLAACELTPLHTTEPELAYLFKHLVTPDVAYKLLTHAMRARLHEQYANYLETEAGEGGESILDQLAYHYERSDNLLKKREYLIKAGESAQRRYANNAALDYYQRSLPLVSIQEQPEVLIKSGQVLELLGRWEEAEAAYQHALEIAEVSHDQSIQAGCLAALGELARKRGQYAAALDYLQRAYGLFFNLNDRNGLAQVLHFQGTVAAHQGDLKSALKLYEESLTIRREQGDHSHVASLLSNLAIVARVQGNYDEARRLNNEALSIRREMGDKWAIAVSLNNLGNVAIDQCEYDEARRLLKESLIIRREVGDMWVVANSLNNLGNLERDQGENEAANTHYLESLKLVREYNDRWAMAYLFEDMGCLACLQGQFERALQLVGAADALRHEISSPRSEAEQKKLDGRLECARIALGERAVEGLLEDGRRMSIESAAAYAAGNNSPRH